MKRRLRTLATSRDPAHWVQGTELAATLGLEREWCAWMFPDGLSVEEVGDRLGVLYKNHNAILYTLLEPVRRYYLSEYLSKCAESFRQYAVGFEDLSRDDKKKGTRAAALGLAHLSAQTGVHLAHAAATLRKGPARIVAVQQGLVLPTDATETFHRDLMRVHPRGSIRWTEELLNEAWRVQRKVQHALGSYKRYGTPAEQLVSWFYAGEDPLSGGYVPPMGLARRVRQAICPPAKVHPNPHVSRIPAYPGILLEHPQEGRVFFPAKLTAREQGYRSGFEVDLAHCARQALPHARQDPTVRIVLKHPHGAIQVLTPADLCRLTYAPSRFLPSGHTTLDLSEEPHEALRAAGAVANPTRLPTRKRKR